MAKKNNGVDDISVKEALAQDAADLSVRWSACVDPAPGPFIPVTPFVIGKKAVNGVKKIVESIVK